MTAPPDNPKIYHIVHMDRLSAILALGGLQSDALIRAQNEVGTTIGMPELKDWRLTRPVDVHPGTFVGEYVPFYFCSRSLMLYVIHMANHPSLNYRGGQGPIVHLEADMYEVMNWADANGIAWAFTTGNASANIAEFRNNRDSITDINWTAINAWDFRDPAVKDGKQAEFLVQSALPWQLIRRIGTRTQDVSNIVAGVIAGAEHRPAVEVQPTWYY